MRKVEFGQRRTAIARIGRLVALFFVCVIVSAGSGRAQAAQELVTCMANPSPAVREPCIRTALASQDPNLRAAGLAAVFRTRNVIVMEFEPPPAVTAFMQRVESGQNRRHDAPPPIDHSINFVEQSGQQISFRVDSFDNQTNTFSVSVRDARFNDGRSEDAMRNNNRGEATISGENLQISFRVNTGAFRSQCSSSLSLVAANELRGALSCSGERMLQRTNARIRFF